MRPLLPALNFSGMVKAALVSRYLNSSYKEVHLMTLDDVKRKVEDILDDIVLNRDEYVKDPLRDMKRNRKLPMKDMLRRILLFGGGTLHSEILNYGTGAECHPSAPSFVQQRDKLKVEAFERIFHETSEILSDPATYEGYRLIAVDGSDIHIPLNRNDPGTFNPGTNGQDPYNLMHLNAAYDIMNGTYLDAVLQGCRVVDENGAFNTIVDRSPCGKKLYIADRNYESYNGMAHCIVNGCDFLIRTKDSARNSIKGGLDLPDTDEFDVEITLNLTRKNSKETRELFRLKNEYRWIPSTSRFDYLEKTKHKDEAVFFTLPFRIVRFRLTEETYEVVVTSLDRELFPPEKLKEIYAMRWGIETSFRTLKYSAGLLAFHSRKTESVRQEIYARLSMYNLASAAAVCISIDTSRKKKHSYKINGTKAIHICRKLFSGVLSAETADRELARSVSAIRDGRSFERKRPRKIVFEFVYRVA